VLRFPTATLPQSGLAPKYGEDVIDISGIELGEVKYGYLVRQGGIR